MREVELYKLLVTKDNEYETELADEIRWISDDELLIWVSYSWLKEFMDSMRKMFGEGLFDDGSFNGNFQRDCVCIDLVRMLCEYSIDLEAIFPQKKYSD